MYQLCQNNQIISDLINQIGPILSAVIGGIIAFKSAKWQSIRKEKKKNVEDANKALCVFQTAVANGFLSPAKNQQVIEDTITKVTSAYAVFFEVIEPSLIYLPKYARVAIQKYRDITHHNITVWIGKLRGDEVYKHDHLNPSLDQTLDDGKARKAYDAAKDALSKYTRGI